MTDKFPDAIIESAWERQNGCCGLCGHPLYDDEYDAEGGCNWAAHHLNGYAFDSVLANCVLLCVETDHDCHKKAHHGAEAGDLILKKPAYPYYGDLDSDYDKEGDE